MAVIVIVPPVLLLESLVIAATTKRRCDQVAGVQLVCWLDGKLEEDSEGDGANFNGILCGNCE